MRAPVVFGIMLLGITGFMPAAEESFSRSLRAADYADAGLTKLSPAELARLDALVRDYKTHAVEAARPETAGAAASNATTAKPDRRRAASSVVLAPGTKVEYSTVESRIVGEFRGWSDRTVFTLENGQRWQTLPGSHYVTGAVSNPAVKIAPGMLGSFWMSIEGVRQRVKVVPLSPPR